MSPVFNDNTWTSSLQFVSDHGTDATQTLPVHHHLQTVASNTSLQSECAEVRFSEMEYLPWDNPHNIISEDVENVIYKIKDNLLGFLFLIGGPANVINMAVFCKQGLKDRVNLCLFALSLADELHLLVFMFFHAEQLHLQFTSGERFGPMLTFLTNINFTGLLGFSFVSTVLSAIISIERCYCVLRPLQYQTLMRTRTMAVIITAVYVIVIGVFSIGAFRYRIGCAYVRELDINLNMPVIGEFYLDHKEFIDLLDGFIFGVVLPGVVMLAVITSTIITLVKLRQIVTWRASASSSISSQEIALTKMLIGTSIFFIICLSPVALIHFVWIFYPEMSSGGRHQNFFLACIWSAQMCAFVNSTFNIFVYYAMGSKFRETFWTLFCRKLSPDNIEDMLHTVSVTA